MSILSSTSVGQRGIPITVELLLENGYIPSERMTFYSHITEYRLVVNGIKYLGSGEIIHIKNENTFKCRYGSSERYILKNLYDLECFIFISSSSRCTDYSKWTEEFSQRHNHLLTNCKY